jgi:hypothetical protein
VTKRYTHPKHEDLYTPVTPELIALFERMKAEHATWRRVCWITNTRMKVMRSLRNGSRKTISMKKLDEMIQATEVGSLTEFTWFTADDLVNLGIWKPTQYVRGRARVKQVPRRK